jgi:hypothetical protein
MEVGEGEVNFELSDGTVVKND